MGKFNILSVNLILFQDNQKNITVGLSGQNNADSGLFRKKCEQFPDYQGEAQFLVTQGCFPKKPIIFEIYIEFGAFWYQICCGSKNFVFGLMAGKFGKFGLKALFVSCAFIVHVAEASADYESPWR